MKVYFDGFVSYEDLVNAFEVSSEQLEGVEMIYALYDGPGYEGYAHVIFRKDGKLYEVNGSHCSCYGLEGQWEPEETTVNALLARPNVSDDAKANIREVYNLS